MLNRLVLNRAIRNRLATSIWYDTLMKNSFNDWSQSKHMSVVCCCSRIHNSWWYYCECPASSPPLKHTKPPPPPREIVSLFNYRNQGLLSSNSVIISTLRFGIIKPAKVIYHLYSSSLAACFCWLEISLRKCHRLRPRSRKLIND